ncbi:MAG: hypothetical protein ACOH1Y_06260 [Propionicimonas sp.]
MLAEYASQAVPPDDLTDLRRMSLRPLRLPACTTRLTDLTSDNPVPGRAGRLTPGHVVA